MSGYLSPIPELTSLHQLAWILDSGDRCSPDEDSSAFLKCTNQKLLDIYLINMMLILNSLPLEL